MTETPAITVVGLGPGSAELLTFEARRALEGDRVFVRTRWHPVAAAYMGHRSWRSFDELYDHAERFEDVYEQIVDILLAEAASGPVVYAVPGHPLVGETSVRLLLERARKRDILVRIVPGLSFVDACLPAIEIDALADNLQLIDALELVACARSEPFSAGQWPISPLRPALVGQVYDRFVAGEVKLALARLYPDDWTVTVLHAAGTPEATAQRVPLFALDHRDPDHLTAVYLPPMPAETARTTEALQQIVARLRAPGGCPWDREQTHESLARHAIEEAYEVADAIESGDVEALREELGDFLLQVVLHAQIAEEEGAFVFEDVVGEQVRKLVRRHPHVFSDATAETASAVIATWERIKREERSARGEGKEHPLGRIPRAMPALARAQALIRRARRHGITVLGSAVYDRWRAITGGDAPTEEEFALLLASLCALALEVGIDAELVLRRWTLATELALQQAMSPTDL